MIADKGLNVIMIEARGVGTTAVCQPGTVLLQIPVRTDHVSNQEQARTGDCVRVDLHQNPYSLICTIKCLER
jgi:hypothetical protein